MGAPLRQKLELFLIVLFTLFAFASYSEYTASTAWLQWATLVIFLGFTYTFDKSFTDESSFVFDPDAVSSYKLVCSVVSHGYPKTMLAHRVAFLFSLFSIDPQDNWRRKTEAGKMQ